MNRYVPILRSNGSRQQRQYPDKYLRVNLGLGVGYAFGKDTKTRHRESCEQYRARIIGRYRVCFSKPITIRKPIRSLMVASKSAVQVPPNSILAWDTFGKVTCRR
jgi:hypothetical protein